MYRGNPPNGTLMAIKNPYIDPSVHDVNAPVCFDQISLIEGSIFSIELNELVWKTLSPNSSSTTAKSVKKLQKLMGTIYIQIIVKKTCLYIYVHLIFLG